MPNPCQMIKCIQCSGTACLLALCVYHDLYAILLRLYLDLKSKIGEFQCHHCSANYFKTNLASTVCLLYLYGSVGTYWLTWCCWGWVCCLRRPPSLCWTVRWTWAWRQCYKTFILHHWHCGKISWSVWPWQDFSGQSNICEQGPEHNIRCSTWIGLCLVHKYSPSLKNLTEDKCTCLFCRSVVDEEKKFCNIDTWRLEAVTCRCCPGWGTESWTRGPPSRGGSRSTRCRWWSPGLSTTRWHLESNPYVLGCYWDHKIY